MTTHEQLLKAHTLRATAAALTTAQKRAALQAMADSLLAHEADILSANQADVAAAEGSISPVMIDRLTLTPARLRDIHTGIITVASLPDPVGEVRSTLTRPNGLTIQQVGVPMGVIAVIYESRPNVTADVAALCLMAGSVSVLRCGREAHGTSAAMVAAMQEALAAQGLPPCLTQLVEDTSRASAQELMTAVGLVDLLLPRGGAGLIRACVEGARVPCIQTGTGICHIYVDRAANLEMALNILENAKTSRPSVCNAAEVLLVHRDVAPVFLPMVRTRLCEGRAARGLPPVELRLSPEAGTFVDGTPAGEHDFDTEFLDYVLAVAVVTSVEEAAAHIALHSTGHSDCIVTDDPEAAALFTRAVDSAAVYVNASTRFTDGGVFGMGCEMGISTQRLHARGPIGLKELCTYKYVVTGSGQVR